MRDISDEVADVAAIAFHEFTWGDEEPLTRRQLGIARQAWKVAISDALDAMEREEAE